MQQQQIDRQRAQKFAGKLMGLYTGGILSLMLDIGHKTGLFDTAAKGSATSQEIAERVGDLLIRSPCSEEPQHLDLPVRQAVRMGRP